jgi:Na+/H+ antiporter NhaD/arsenite permease-like protein
VAFVTNDVTLFVVIPFTVIAGRISDFDVEDAVVLELIATNLLGCLTPLGNPQNLFIYHRAGWSAAHFVRGMLPFVGWNACGLLIAIFLMRGTQKIEAARIELPARNGFSALAGALCFVLVLLEIGHVAPAWGAAAAALKATGQIPSLADFPVPAGPVVTPDEGRRALYDRRFEQYLTHYHREER